MDFESTESAVPPPGRGIEGTWSVPSWLMAEATKKRRWPRRLLVLAVLIGVVALVRDRQISRNEARFGPVPPAAPIV